MEGQPPESNGVDKSQRQPPESNGLDKSQTQPPQSNNNDKSQKQTPESNDNDESQSQPPESNGHDASQKQPLESSGGDESKSQPPLSNGHDASQKQPLGNNGGDESQSQPPESNGEGGNNRRTRGKIFVGGLPDGLTLEEFRSFFAVFGTITDIVIIHDRETKKPRGFGFVTFDSDEPVKKALRSVFYELKNKRVQVQRAVPKVDRSDNNGGVSGPTNRPLPASSYYARPYKPQGYYSYYGQNIYYQYPQQYYYVYNYNPSFPPATNHYPMYWRR